MPFPINGTAEVAAIRPSDSIGLTARYGAEEAIEGVELDLSPRSDETHCLVAFPALPNRIPESASGVRLWMRAAYCDAENARMPFVTYLAGYRDGKHIGQTQARFFAGPEEANLVLDLDIPDGAEQVQLVVYADRRYRGLLRLVDPRLVVGRSEYRIGRGALVEREVSLERGWRQEGQRVICASVYGEHWAEMPAGWRLDEVHPAALTAAEWILYAAVDRMAFGVVQPPPAPEDDDRRYIGSNTLLSYSLGTDSTAALALLPDDTIRYYCRRPYRQYFTRAGAVVTLPDHRPWEERLDRLDNVVVVPNTFEQIQIAAGGRHGFAHNFGYAAIGLLLADHTDAGVLAFGSVMEQVFLRSGHLFADVVALPGSTYNALRRLVNTAGLFLALPTAGCSEVVTSRVSEAGRFSGLAISCPRAAPDGSPCGTCFKCFRKLRIEGRTDAPEPEESVVHVLEKHPLKSATSVVYGAQRSGYGHPALDRFADLDLGFLDRYFPYAIEHMLPPDLAAHVRGELAALGVGPMSARDEDRLRRIGQVFWPEAFDPKRAGLSTH